MKIIVERISVLIRLGIFSHLGFKVRIHNRVMRNKYIFLYHFEIKNKSIFVS